MIAWPGSPAAEELSLRALWNARPARQRPVIWALLLGLDMLPWPWGEDIVARLFLAGGVLQPSRRWRPALAWALRQPGHSARPLALALLAFLGRWVARSALLGIRTPEQLRRHVAIDGAEHLASPGPSILLGFHVGPPNTDVALRASGHPLAWLGGQRFSRGWSRAAWRPFLDARENLSADGEAESWAGALFRARQLLLDGGRIFAMADTGVGREAFRLALPGGPMIVNRGWLSLHGQTGARVLPVLSHLDGRTHVITIHPPLPSPEAPIADALGVWREILGRLVDEYVRRFPAQCPVRAFFSGA